ncbi:MAG TPA: sugar transferase [Gemmatimonadaceae bacterium]|nr:sugar transferase [Gemmatimonadaceae bacterium]
MNGKRVFDLAWTVPGLLVLAPLLGAVALLVRLVDGRPVFFRQERVGLHGRPFRIWKFRTMTAGAATGPALTVAADARVTPLGRWLRATKLDELPQLFNVLAGEMSLVGPRPEVPRFVAQYTEAQRQVLTVRPGITDPACLSYRHEGVLLARSADPERTYVAEIMPEKIRLNLAYARTATRWSDFRVILRTFGSLLPTPAGLLGDPNVSRQT